MSCRTARHWVAAASAASASTRASLLLLFMVNSLFVSMKANGRKAPWRGRRMRGQAVRRTRTPDIESTRPMQALVWSNQGEAGTWRARQRKRARRPAGDDVVEASGDLLVTAELERR